MSKEIPPLDINDIRQVEKVAARNCLGKDFYAALVADLEDYSEVAEWNGESVAENAVVLYKGNYYQATTTTTNEPTVKTDWQDAPKFESEYFNDLWCEVLGRYLALLVIQNTIPAISTPPTAQGTVKRQGEGYKAAQESEVVRLQNWISSQVATAFENLDEYLKDETDEERFAAFADYPGNDDDACCACSTDCDRGTEFYENGAVGLPYDGGHYMTFFPESVNTNCGCASCLKKAKAATNRYVIA